MALRALNGNIPTVGILPFRAAKPRYLPDINIEYILPVLFNTSEIGIILIILLYG